MVGDCGTKPTLPPCRTDRRRSGRPATLPMKARIAVNDQHVLRIGLLALGAFALAGCEETPTMAIVPVPTPVAPASGSSGAGGAGGRSAGGGAPAPAVPAPCGSVTCQLGRSGVGMLVPRAPCCIDATMGTCGWLDMGGTTCTAPPPADPECNKAMATGANGCCLTGMDRCGVDASMFGAGCFDLMGTMFADPVNNPPQRCDGTLIPQQGGAGGAGGAGGGAGGAAGASGANGSAGSGGSSAGASGRGGAAGGSAAGRSGGAAGAAAGRSG
jgi:hypothetical protein